MYLQLHFHFLDFLHIPPSDGARGRTGTTSAHGLCVLGSLDIYRVVGEEENGHTRVMISGYARSTPPESEILDFSIEAVRLARRRCFS